MSRGRKTPPSQKNLNQFAFVFEQAPPPTAPARVLPDAAAREIAKTALDRSLLVEAGAGTG